MEKESHIDRLIDINRSDFTLLAILKPQKWEYKMVIDCDTNSLTTEEMLNELGNEGWELITVTSHNSDSFSMYYFKRPKIESK